MCVASHCVAVDDLLNAKVKVVVYNGQLDLIVDTLGEVTLGLGELQD